MNIKRATIASALLCTCIAGLAPRSAAAAEDVTLQGCLIKGDGDGGYLLSNAPAEPAWQRSGDARIQPDAVGTSGGFESIFYWLDDDDALGENVGRRVEIVGEVEGELDDGEIELDRKENWTEMTVKSDGKRMKANVPNSSVAPPPGDKGDRKLRVLVRKVDVEKVRMLGPTCEAR